MKGWLDKVQFTGADMVKGMYLTIVGVALFFGLRSEIRDEKSAREQQIEAERAERVREDDLIKLRVGYLERDGNKTSSIHPHNEYGLIPEQIRFKKR